ncbi:CAP domain-containing protein [Halobaculum sp. CBA1158]|uniref:CAP domain-containing protein n=1 Tax=Halobaculum sp. CBA1158 TaxID=2904243 RepID=UPI001F2FEBA4|nr:CAP domain-containing protein [Halobaculum sp. CBA1158]UIO99026.1 CAP domain-containing protein [Halobaculum sp. CBA1158]
MILLTGCLSSVGSNPEPIVRSQEPVVFHNETPESPKFGHQQADENIITPSPLQNKTQRTDLNVTLVENILFKKLNEYRSVDNAGSLTFDPRLAMIARHHSYDMATRNYFNHTSPEGETFSDRLREAEYDCYISRENIAGMYWKNGQSETENELAEAYLRGFIQSPEHNAAMIHPEMTTVGIGIYVAKDGRAYATMNLCDADPTEDNTE